MTQLLLFHLRATTTGDGSRRADLSTVAKDGAGPDAGSLRDEFLMTVWEWAQALADQPPLVFWPPDAGGNRDRF